VAIETRANDRKYFYRSRRVDGRVVKEYVASGTEALIAAETDRQQRQERATADAASGKELDQINEVDAVVAESSLVFDAALSAALLKAGYHHHRGEWRKKRSGHGSQTSVEISSRT
jgi:hypothetical protein